MQKKVLIVDDQEDMRTLISFALFRCGYNLLQAENGPQAIDIIEKEDPDIILLDVMMPKMSGLEVCEKIRANGNQRARIIFLSACGQSSDIQTGLNLGANAYITKPFSPIHLIDEIKNQLQQQNLGANEQ
ncbi:MAG: response regulator [Zetaproteobacteria bacterium]|nr:response regulator [Zetaproteobacteria bacterium]